MGEREKEGVQEGGEKEAGIRGRENQIFMFTYQWIGLKLHTNDGENRDLVMAADFDMRQRLSGWRGDICLRFSIPQPSTRCPDNGSLHEYFRLNRRFD